MSSITLLQNHQIRLASRPVGLPTRANWSHTCEAVAEPGPGGVLVKTLYLSLDPAMRGWMNEGKSYIPPVEIGAVMRAGPINVDQVLTRRYCLAPSATARSRDAASSAAFTGCPVSQPPMCRNATPHKASIHSFWSFRQSM